MQRTRADHEEHDVTMTTTRRTDVHRPSAMDPADYVYVGEADDHESEGSFDFDFDALAELTGVQVQGEDASQIPWAHVEHVSAGFTGEGDRIAWKYTGGCDHCGTQGIRYWTFFVHTPSGEVVSVGSRCASQLGMDSKEAQARRRAVEYRRVSEKGRAFREASPANDEAVEFLLAQLEPDHGPGMPFYITGDDGRRVLKTIRDDFYASVLRRFLSKGELSEKQVAAVLRSKARQAERAAEREARDEEMDDPEPADVPLTAERITITGRLVATKVQEGDFGDTVKMLVIDDRGFRVWGTCPSVIIDRAFEQGIEEGRNDGGVKQFLDGGMKVRVQFDAKIERSRKDTTFGFFSRPTKAKVI